MASDPLFVLLPSPLLGATAWEPAGDELRRLGQDVLVAPVPMTPDGPSEVLATFLEALPGDRDLVLVPHSNAGLYAPALVGARTVVAVVFVDAALPDDGEATALAPATLRARIAELAGPDGMLPPWTRWWDDADISPLFPSPEVRALVEATQPRLPLSYFDASLPVPAHWDRTPCAYLAFGDTYAPERDVAHDRGWPTATRPGAHLHMLVDPTGVAEAIVHLGGKLSVHPRQSDTGAANR